MTKRDRIYSVVRLIPRGRVATYGQVAELAALAGQPRLVGYALSALDDESTVPWHRVVNAQGKISLRSSGSGYDLNQRLRLEREGIVFDAGDKISLATYRWKRRNR